MRRIFRVLFLLAPLALGRARPACAQDQAPPPPYFYFGYDYGTQSLYSPLWVFVNRGYDVLQDHTAGRNVFDQNYRTNGGNVLNNVIHPFSNISNLGWKTFLTEEIFPLSYTHDTARWLPNYSLHLIGGGMTFTALREWFVDHGVPLPRVFSAATLMAAAFINESIENHGVVGRNTDCLADIYVFDIGGIILFSFDTINRFFSRQVVVSDWSLQPSFTLPKGYLHNQGNYFAAKWSLPFFPRLRLFSYFGEATTGGLSLRLDDELSFSAAAGGAVTRLESPSSVVVANVVKFAPTAGVFLDRRESLLASLQITDVADYFIHLNVYPHAFIQRGPALGLWAVVDKRGRPAVGVSAALLLGMGVGYTALPE